MAIDLGKLKDQLVFSGQGTISELTTDLDQIALVEAQLKQRITLIRWSALGVFLLMAWLAVVLGGIFVLLGIALPMGILIYSAVLARNVVVPQRVAFFRLLLQTLGHDAGQKGRVKAMIHLRKTMEKLPDGPNPQKKGATLKFFRDPWLTVDSRLSDGTSVHAGCTDLLRVRMKRNARGKTKAKERLVCLLRVQLDYAPETFGEVKAVAHRIDQPFRLPTGATLKAHGITEKTMAMKTIVKGNVTPDNLQKTTEGLLLGAYRILNLARQGAHK